MCQQFLSGADGFISRISIPATRRTPLWQASFIKRPEQFPDPAFVCLLILISAFSFQNFSVCLGQSTMLEPGMDQSL
jgi:hypothetical protein